jgi:heme-degrading monooxygenase HmoA
MASEFMGVPSMQKSERSEKYYAFDAHIACPQDGCSLNEGEPMNKVVDAPEPPYYAVIAPAELQADVRGYPEMAAMLVELAQQQPGFIGIESGGQKGFALAVSYWASLDAIQAWRNNARHLLAKDKGRADWFSKYVTRIAKVERVY